MALNNISGKLLQTISSNIVQSFSFETLDFQRRIIANGGNALSFVVLTSIDYYVKALKAANIWSLLSSYCLYPFVGGNGSTGSKNSFAVNLMNSSYTLMAHNITDAMCTVNGYQGDGTSSYWNTGLANNVVPFASTSFGAYCNVVNDLQAFPYRIIIGANGIGSNSFISLLVRKTITGVELYDEGAANVATYTPINSNPVGFNSGSRNGTNLFIYGQGKVQNSITAANSIDYRNSNTYYIGAINGGSAFSTNRFSCPFIGLALTQAQTNTLNTIQQNFEQMLNRSV